MYSIDLYIVTPTTTAHCPREAMESSEPAGCTTCCAFVAARQGPKQKQPHNLMEIPAKNSLRQLGKSILPDAELLSVKACKDIDGKPGYFHGGMLDKTIEFVVTQSRLMYVKCCFATNRETAEIGASAKDGKQHCQSVFKAMMDDKRRRITYYWPDPYLMCDSKRAIRNIANDIISSGRKNLVEYGGFSSSLDADKSRQHLWTLAEVLYAIATHAAAMCNRSMPVPAVFSDIAESEWINAKDPPKYCDGDSFCEQLDRHVRTLRTISQRSSIMSETFRMSAPIETLADNIARYRLYLINNSKQRRDRIGSSKGTGCDDDTPTDDKAYDKDYYRILTEERSVPAIQSSDRLATISRIEEMLEKSGPYVPVRIDKLLLDDNEFNHVKKRTSAINRRLQFIMKQAKFRFNVQLYRCLPLGLVCDADVIECLQI